MLFYLSFLTSEVVGPLVFSLFFIFKLFSASVLLIPETIDVILP